MRLIGSCILLAALLIPVPVVKAQAPAPVTMAVYAAPDSTLSFAYPSGWTVSVGQFVRISKNPADPRAPIIELIPMTAAPGIGSSAVIERTLGFLRGQKPSLTEHARQRFSISPDGSSVFYSWTESGTRIAGFAFVIAQGENAIWANILGAEDELTKFNPVLLLQYVLESLAAGPKPNIPSVTLARINDLSTPEVKESGGEDPAVNAFFWNNWRYITPGAFDTSITLW